MKQITMIFGNRQLTTFMQHADVFESFKVIMNPPITATVVDDFGDSNVQAILKGCEKEPYFLIAIYDQNKTYFRNPDVKVVSDGTQFGMLDDLLPNQS